MQRFKLLASVTVQASLCWICSETQIVGFLMHQSFVTTGWGIAGLKCKAIAFRVTSQCRGNDGVLTLGFLLQGDFLM